MINIFWFRKDLRLEDNKALQYFISNLTNSKYSFIYIKNPETLRYYGPKRISFLINSLSDLNINLNKYGFRLQIFEGKSVDVFLELKKKYGQINVYANGQVEPYSIKRDDKIRNIIEFNNGSFNLYSDTTIFDLNQIRKDDGNPYTIFTPFKNKFLKNIRTDNFEKYSYKFSKLSRDNYMEISLNREYSLEGKNTLHQSDNLFCGGRKEAKQLLSGFCKNKIQDYKKSRDFPFLDATSLLSPHIHFGTVNIRECFREVLKATSDLKNKWINELIWREFYYNISYNFPSVINKSFKSKYDNLRWNYSEKLLSNWKNGLTGYPMVDAGMRQLNEKGWMHNRVRMITAMFLTKDLFIDWRLGEKYFAEHLIDKDFSSNNGGWQWCASTGCDAQPYFRIFNPEMQAKKFDPEGKYIRKYVPELRNLPVHMLHNTKNISRAEEIKYNFKLGRDYPSPIVNHQKAKERTIFMFKKINKTNY